MGYKTKVFPPKYFSNNLQHKRRMSHSYFTLINVFGMCGKLSFIHHGSSTIFIEIKKKKEWNSWLQHKIKHKHKKDIVPVFVGGLHSNSVFVKYIIYIYFLMHCVLCIYAYVLCIWQILKSSNHIYIFNFVCR